MKAEAVVARQIFIKYLLCEQNFQRDLSTRAKSFAENLYLHL